VRLAVDTSVAIPLVARSRHDHAAVVHWWNGQDVALTGHSLAETYSVLTKLPGDARLASTDAARLLNARFAAPLLVSGPRARMMALAENPQWCSAEFPIWLSLKLLGYLV